MRKRKKGRDERSEGNKKNEAKLRGSKQRAARKGEKEGRKVNEEEDKDSDNEGEEHEGKIYVRAKEGIEIMA